MPEPEQSRARQLLGAFAPPHPPEHDHKAGTDGSAPIIARGAD